jgi:hypothetical protein
MLRKRLWIWFELIGYAAKVMGLYNLGMAQSCGWELR